MEFSSDGATLATAGSDWRTTLWDVPTREPIVSLEGHTEGVLWVALSPDGRTLATSSLDATAALWSLSPAAPETAIDQIRARVHRDLTPDERATYLPNTVTAPVCPD